MLEGLVDVYLPDFKFYSSQKAAKYLRAADYPQTARMVIAEMVRQTGACRFDEKGRIQKGVIVRHLLMPHGLLEAKMIVKELYRAYKDTVYLSLQIPAAGKQSRTAFIRVPRVGGAPLQLHPAS